MFLKIVLGCFVLFVGVFYWRFFLSLQLRINAYGRKHGDKVIKRFSPILGKQLSESSP